MTKSKTGRRHFFKTAAIGLASSYIANAAADEVIAPPKKPEGSFQNKVVLITGATSGVGQVCAETFAKSGAKVFFCGRREKEGTELVQAWHKVGLDVTFFRADVRSEAEVKAFVEACVKKHGRLDIAFNNAGIYPMADFVTSPTEIHVDTLATNVNGLFFSMKYEIEQMLKQKNGGVIINMASTSAHKAATYTSASYCASKHAVIGLTKTAALMYAEKKIRVNAVSPAQVAISQIGQPEDRNKDAVLHQESSSRIPAGRLCSPEDVVNAVLWLASDKSAYTHGHSLILDGGRLA